MVGQHLLGNAAERPDDLTAQARVSAIDTHWDFAWKITVMPDDSNMQGNIFGKLPIKLHVAVEADARNGAVAGVGVFP